MDTINEIVNLVSNTAVTAVMLGYFVYRDLVFMNKLEESLATLQKTIEIFGKKGE